MAHVLASAIMVCGILWLIGLGPATLLPLPRAGRAGYVLALAPVAGYTLLSLAAFPLARFVGPVRAWAWLLTGLLVLVSAALLAVDWRRHPADCRAWLTARSLSPVALLGLGSAVVFSPLALGSLQHFIFRTNPSDAFLYMSLAETLRQANWHTIQAGAALSWDNLPGLTQLAAQAPAALFSARHTALPLALNKMALFAWMAEVGRIGIPAFYYAHHLVAYWVALPLAAAVAAELGLPRWQRYLSALVIAAGFWSRFVLDTDGGYEVSSFPVLLLAVYAWMRLEQDSQPALSRGRVWLALALAALLGLYGPLLLLVAGAFAVYYGAGLLQRVQPLSMATRHGLTAGLVLASLLVTGQVDFLVRNALNLVARAGNERLFAAPAADLLKADGAAAVWGMPVSVLVAGWPNHLALPATQVVVTLAVLFTGALAYGLYAAWRSAPAAAERVIVALLIAGALIGALSFLADNDRAAGKALTYIHPYLTLALLLAARSLGRLLRPNLHRLAVAAVAGWLLLQPAAGLYYSFRVIGVAASRHPKPDTYDVRPITRYLDQAKPALLLVDIQRDSTWMFAYYCMLVFSQYPAYFQSGLIIDNGTTYQNLWLGELPRAPDYAVVRRSADDIGPAGLGTAVAGTADLILYRIETADLAPFAARAAAVREREAAKMPFPSLQP